MCNNTVVHAALQHHCEEPQVSLLATTSRVPSPAASPPPPLMSPSSSIGLHMAPWHHVSVRSSTHCSVVIRQLRNADLPGPLSNHVASPSSCTGDASGLQGIKRPPDGLQDPLITFQGNFPPDAKDTERRGATVSSRRKNTQQSVSSRRLISRLITEVAAKGTSVSFPR